LHINDLSCFVHYCNYLTQLFY